MTAFRDSGALEHECRGQAAQTRADDRHREVLKALARRRRTPLQAARERVDREFLEAQLQVVGVADLLAHGQAKAYAQPVRGADVDRGRARIAMGLQELHGLAPQQRNIRVLHHRRRPEAGDDQGRPCREHLEISGELIDQSTQHHRVGVPDRIFNGCGARLEQLVTNLRVGSHWPRSSC